MDLIRCNVTATARASKYIGTASPDGSGISEALKWMKISTNMLNENIGTIEHESLQNAAELIKMADGIEKTLAELKIQESVTYDLKKIKTIQSGSGFMSMCSNYMEQAPKMAQVHATAYAYEQIAKKRFDTEREKEEKEAQKQQMMTGAGQTVIGGMGTYAGGTAIVAGVGLLAVCAPLGIVLIVGGAIAASMNSSDMVEGIGNVYDGASGNGEKGWNPLKDTVFAGNEELYGWLEGGSTLFCTIAVPAYGAISESGSLLKGATTATKVVGVIGVSTAGGNATGKLVTDMTGSRADGEIAGILAGAAIGGLAVKGFAGKTGEIGTVGEGSKGNGLFKYDNPKVGVSKADEGGFTSLNNKYVFKDSEIVKQIQDISSQSSIDRMKAFNNSLETLLQKYNMTLDEFELLSGKPINELNESELKTICEIRNAYETPENGTLMSKVIPDVTFENCINNGEYSKTVVGCVAKAQDTAGLKTYNDYFNTFGLGYDGSPYKNPAKDSIYVMRFTTDNNENIKIPFGGTTDGELEKISRTCDISVDDLIKMDSPFQGNGFTKNEIGGLGSPEYTISRNGPVDLNDYSAIYKVSRSGNETLEAIYFDENWYVVK